MESEDKLDGGNVRHSNTTDIRHALRDHLITDITDHYEAAGQKISARGIWYRLLAGGHIQKDKDSPGYYSSTSTNDIINELREAGRISFDVVEDPSREIHRPVTFDGVRDVLGYAARVHELNIWKGLPDRCVVLIEKRGLEGVVRGITNDYQCAFLATGGYNSRTMGHELASTIADYDCDTVHVLMFGDWDGDGVYAHECIRRYTTERLGSFDNKPAFDFRTVGVTNQHIDKYDLITREPNTASPQWPFWIEHCAKVFKTKRPTEAELRCVEIDALEPSDLQRIVEAAIKKYLPKGHVDEVRERQDAQRERIEEIAKREKNE